MREYLKALFAERKVVRRTLMLWGAGLTTYAVLEFFANLAAIDTPQASVIIAIIGILATVTAYATKMRELDDKCDK